MTVAPPADALSIVGAALGKVRTDWTQAQVTALFAAPFTELIFMAQQAHRAHFDPRDIQISTLLSIKTGGCPEDCAYCPQSARHKTGVQAETLLDVQTVLEAAAEAQRAGASRFCLGAAWRSPTQANLAAVCAMVEGINALGLESCVTLGMVNAEQARQLKSAGLDYYNHNIDTSPRYYGEIITTRTFADRLETIENVREAGINVCCGGIVGLGESLEDRIEFILTLATLPQHPQSVPINMLVRVAGTPLEASPPLDPLEFVRTIAVARITMPASRVRLSAGREAMSDELQALCLVAGANSIFYGPKLLTTSNPEAEQDARLLARLGMTPAV
jgi:biotin synthase